MSEVSSEEQGITLEFVNETREMLDQIEPAIIDLGTQEKKGQNYDEIIGGVFRQLHTIKGTAGFLHYHSLQDLTHDIESNLQYLRDEPQRLTSELIDKLISGFDVIRSMLGQIETKFQDQGFEEKIKEVIRNLSQNKNNCPTSVSTLETKPQTERSSHPSEQEKKKSKILYIDDQTDFHSIIKFAFKIENLEVIVADNETTGLQLAKDQKPDLILLDIMLPIYGEDGGFEVLNQLKADPILKNIPVIMLTARLDRETVLRALNLGAEDFERKPFNVEQLLEKVLFCLARHIQVQEDQRTIELDIEKDIAQFTESKMSAAFIRRYILQNVFLKNLMGFMKKSMKCQNVQQLLELIILSTTKFGWRCTVRLNHGEEILSYSDTKSSLLGDTIIKNIHLKYGGFYHNASYGIFMSDQHIFTLLIRNMPEKNEENKESIEVICRQAEEFVEVVEGQYELVK